MPPVSVKPVWQSKTAWVNVIMAIAAFIPPVNDYIGKHPEAFVWGFAALNMVLRLISKGRIVLND